MAYEYYSASKHYASVPRTKFGDAKTFHLTLVSAQNLSCPHRLIGRRIKVHAEFQLDSGNVEKTDTDVAGGTSPTWNFDAHYPITDSMRKNGGVLVVRLKYKRTVSYTLIGEVKIVVSDLFDMFRDRGENAKACPVTVKGDPNGDGTLNISYEFSEAQI